MGVCTWEFLGSEDPFNGMAVMKYDTSRANSIGKLLMLMEDIS